MITVETENNVLDEIKWLNYQCGSLIELCYKILEGSLGLENIQVALMQIEKGIIRQIEDTIQHLPQSENHIKCPKCGGTEFLISEYANWEARAHFSEIEKKWILEAYNNTNNGIDLIECKQCSKDNFSDDYTGNFEMEVQFNG